MIRFNGIPVGSKKLVKMLAALEGTSKKKVAEAAGLSYVAITQQLDRELSLTSLNKVLNILGYEVVVQKKGQSDEQSV